MSASNAFVVISPEELSSLVESAVRRALHERPPEDPWLDTEGAAALLQCCKRSVSRWVASEGLPHHRVGREYRFRTSELHAWLEAR